MGGMYSNLWHTPEPMVVPVAHKHEKTILPQEPAALPLLELSNEEMEREFERIYQRTKDDLSTLSYNPCEQTSQQIAECLEKHYQRMSECFEVMHSYQACIAKRISEKLAEDVTTKQNNQKVQNNS